MTEFVKYQHVERLGNKEVDGILNGKCYVYSKVDGTNSSVWLNKDGNIKAGSRKRELTLEHDNAGFYQQVLNDKNIKAFFSKYPDLRLYGEFLCLSGDTKIRLVSGGKRGHIRELREIYHYFKSDVYEKSQHIRKDGTHSYTLRKSWWERYGLPKVFSLFIKEDKIKPQQIKDIVFSGIKEVYEVETRKGYKIKSTLKHKFLTNNGWKMLKDLKNNDVIAVTELINRPKRRKLGKGTKKIHDKYKKLKKERVCEKCGINNSLDIHHIDENWKNNNDDNLQVLCVECHRKSHNNVTFNNLSYNYEFDKIISIEKKGFEDCYDIMMSNDENSASFVANGFIVHNCPHTLRTYKDDAWNNFYVFDVVKNNFEDNEIFEHIPYEEYVEKLEEFNISYIPPIAILNNPTYEELIELLKTNTFLIKDGEGQGEGVVVKNYHFFNKYGRQTWAKIINETFNNRTKKQKGLKIKVNQNFELEMVNKYVTEHLVNKTYAKMTLNEDWTSKRIPELLGRVWQDIVDEEMENIMKDADGKEFNTKTLKGLCNQKIKEIKKELFYG